MVTETSLVGPRAAILCANVVLSAAILAAAVDNLIARPLRDPGPGGVVDPGPFSVGGFSASRNVPRMDLAAEDLQPVEEVAQGTGDGADVRPPAPDLEPEIEGGPLAAAWRYVAFILDREDPLRTIAMLEESRSGAPPSLRPRGPSATRASSVAAVGGRRVGPIAPRGGARPARIAFSVGERWIRRTVAEGLVVDFVVDSADAEALRYRLPTDPSRIYRLPFSGGGPARAEASAPAPGGGRAEPPGAPGSSPDREPMIGPVPPNHEEELEAEYRRWTEAPGRASGPQD